MTILLPALSIAALIAYYFLVFKPHQDGKSKSKKQSKSRTNTDVSCNQLTSLEDWEG